MVVVKCGRVWGGVSQHQLQTQWAVGEWVTLRKELIWKKTSPCNSEILFTNALVSVADTPIDTSTSTPLLCSALMMGTRAWRLSSDRSTHARRRRVGYTFGGRVTCRWWRW